MPPGYTPERTFQEKVRVPEVLPKSNAVTSSRFSSVLLEMVRLPPVESWRLRRAE